MLPQPTIKSCWIIEYWVNHVDKSLWNPMIANAVKDLYKPSGRFSTLYVHKQVKTSYEARFVSQLHTIDHWFNKNTLPSDIPLEYWNSRYELYAGSDRSESVQLYQRSSLWLRISLPSRLYVQSVHGPQQPPPIAHRPQTSHERPKPSRLASSFATHRGS
ncbi:hypothetical protein LTR49_027276 [Elasticomyces elasticus]|nr:hypothetical protein LTR49_027276 [Elasticomyces elasticus]